MAGERGTDPIESFFGPYRFLSNFWPAPVDLDGVTYPTVEHAYQAAKTDDPVVREAIRRCDRPGDAKAAGGATPVAPGWEERRIAVMRDLLAQKFSAAPLRTQLLDTGWAPLVEGNGWGDTFWGVCRGDGTNHLGNLLMAERNRLRGRPEPVLAVDLEGTLVSNAVSAFARPGLGAFLGWASTRFAEVVLYTAVRTERAEAVLDAVVELDDIPSSVLPARVITQVDRCKRLHRVADDDWAVLLVDDQAGAVCPAEVDRWIRIEEWSAPYARDDAGLRAARAALETRIAERWADAPRRA